MNPYCKKCGKKLSNPNYKYCQDCWRKKKAEDYAAYEEEADDAEDS